jgi:hypothetical protein
VCEKPDAVDPKERNERQQPESLEVLIMLQDFEIVDVKSENDDRSVAACGSEAAQLLNVLDPVPASTRWASRIAGPEIDFLLRGEQWQPYKIKLPYHAAQRFRLIATLSPLAR